MVTPFKTANLAVGIRFVLDGSLTLNVKCRITGSREWGIGW